MENRKIIGIGRTAEIYDYSNGKILKLYRKHIEKIIAEREYAVNQVLMALNIRIPKCYDFIEENNRYGIVFEKITGKSMMRKLSEKPWQIKKTAKSLASIHLEIHKVTTNNLTDSKVRLKKNIESTNLLSRDIKDIILSGIDVLPDGNKLCHGDFHPDNILTSGGNKHVIDWMTATSGNPCSDLARTKILFQYGALPEEKSRMEKMITSYGRNILLKEYLKEYLKNSTIKREEIGQWELPHMAARLIESISNNEKEILLKKITEKVKRGSIE